MRGVGGGEDASAVGVDLLGVAVVDGRGGHQADAGVAVIVVVPVEELAAERSGVLDRVEPGGEPGPVLQRLELRFGVRVVGRGVGRVCVLVHAEVGEQERDRLAMVIELPRSACTVSCRG